MAIPQIPKALGLFMTSTPQIIEIARQPCQSRLCLHQKQCHRPDRWRNYWHHTIHSPHEGRLRCSSMDHLDLHRDSLPMEKREETTDQLLVWSSSRSLTLPSL